jgi:hypothetical protein
MDITHKDWYIEHAIDQYGGGSVPEGGDIDFDTNPVVRESKNGAFVAAWVWVAKVEGKTEEDDLDTYADDYFDPADEPELVRGSLAWRSAKNDHDSNYQDGE